MALAGKGMFIWKVREIYAGDVARIADEAQRGGFSHVLVKVADGRYPYNVVGSTDYAGDLIAQLRTRGIQAWGWQYVYGANAAAEADMGARAAQKLGLQGFVVDAEGPFKAKGMNKIADQYMKRLRKQIPGIPLALSTYRYPNSHREFPFDVFLDYCDLAMPQVYWEGSANAAQQLQRSLSEYRALKRSVSIVPTGAAYSNNGWAPTPQQIVDFLKEVRSLGLTAANFWEWAGALENGGSLWNAIQGYDWTSGQETAAIDPAPAPEVPLGPAYIGPIYARLKHDYQWMTDPETGKPVRSRMETSDWNNGFSLDSYPAVVPLWAGPKGGDGAYKYSKEWAKFLRASNPENFAGLERVSAGLFNPRSDNQSSFPINLDQYDGDTVAEGIGSTGNLYQVVEEKSGSVRVKLIDFQSLPPTPDLLNYEDAPWLMNAFTAVTKDGALQKALGKDVVFPNLGKPDAGWVPKERVEYFPPLPMAVTVTDRLNIRKGPGTDNEIVGHFSIGDTAVVSDYRPQGSSVWGKIAEDRWIALLYTTAGGSVYYTTWKMETAPPLGLLDPRPYLKPILSPQDRAATDPQPGPTPASSDILGKYFAALNKADAHAMAVLYAGDSAKLVAEDRKFNGEKAIYSWYQRMFGNKLPGATFEMGKAS